jgi:hypothetical protein
MSTKTLAQSLRDEATAKAKRAMAEAESKIRIAEAFDASGCPHRPWFFTGNVKPAYDGDMGSLSFKDVAPDVAAEIMDMFPPVPTVYYEGRYKGVRPVSALKKDTKVTVPIDGFRLRLDGGIGYGPSVKLEWNAMLGDLQVGLSLDLKQLHGILPRIAARYKYHGSEPYKVESSDIVWPELKYPRPHVVKYSRGSDTAFNSFLCYGTEMRAMVQAWVDELNRRGQVTRAAYEKDKAALVAASVIYSADMEARERATYDAEKLRAGTFEQWRALRTPGAAKDRALAEKHWSAYCADPDNGMSDSPVKPSEYAGYFEHYAWACNYLRRLGLYEVNHNGKAYKYGSAWL